MTLDDIDDALAEWEFWERNWESAGAMHWEPNWDQPELRVIPGSATEIMHREGVDGYAAQAQLDRAAAVDAVRATVAAPPGVDLARVTCHGGEPWAPRHPHRPLNESELHRVGMLVDQRIAFEVMNPRSCIRITGV
jgi:hypothetical protein